jgi:hypothetical protein
MKKGCRSDISSISGILWIDWAFWKQPDAAGISGKGNAHQVFRVSTYII